MSVQVKIKEEVGIDVVPHKWVTISAEQIGENYSENIIWIDTFERHSFSKCMKCEAPPTYECLWAEGMGHAWFCTRHMMAFVKEKLGESKREGWGFDIDSIKKIENGLASKLWRDNKGENVLPAFVKKVKQNSPELKSIIRKPRKLIQLLGSDEIGNNVISHAWVTLPGRGAINVGGGAGGKGIGGKEVPALKTATGKEAGKIGAIQDFLVAKEAHAKAVNAALDERDPAKRSQLRGIAEEKRKVSAAARAKAKTKGMTDAELDSIKASDYKDCNVNGSSGNHSIFEKPPPAIREKKPLPLSREEKKLPPTPRKEPPAITVASGRVPSKAGETGEVDGIKVTYHGKTTGNQDHFTVGTRTQVYIPDKVSNDDSVRLVTNAHSRIPERHRARMKEVRIDGQMGWVPQGLEGEIVATSNYISGTVSFKSKFLKDKAASGNLIHESAHLCYRSQPSDLGKIIQNKGKDISIYGTRNNPKEAWAEAYTKYFSTGKVTTRGGGSFPKATAWFQKEYGNPPRKPDASLIKRK